MENINDEMMRSNVIYNLSETDDFNSCHESNSDEIDIDERDSEDDADGSNSTSIDNESDDIHVSDGVDVGEYTLTAPWFTTEEITYNTITDNPGDSSNFYPLGDDLFEGQCFADK